MALRPEMFGCRLNVLRTVTGSGDQTLFEKMARKSDGVLDFECPGNVEAIIARAVNEGVPFPDLDAENEDHVSAAVLLMRGTQQLEPLDSNGWRMDAFWDLKGTVGKSVSGDQIFSYFEIGRPIFGKRIESSWSYYGFLTASEVKTFDADIQRLRHTNKELASPDFLDGFVNVLLGWTTRLRDSGMDLWWYAE